MTNLNSKNFDPSKLQDVEELALLPLVVKDALVNSYDGGVVVILRGPGKTFAENLDASTGTALMFARSGLSEHAHIKTIYQVYLGTMRELGITLESVTLESQHGDVLYCRLEWCKKDHRRIYTVMSLGDALVLMHLADAKLQVVRKVLDNMDDCDEWVYENDIMDDDMDDD